MEITFAPRGILQMDHARLIFRNFSGEGSKFNREGDKNFSVLIDDQEIADALVEQGWNLKIKPPRDEGDIPFMHLPVKVKFNDRGPKVYLRSGVNQIELDEDSISCLDNIDTDDVELDIRPYDWEVNGKTGRTAYLHAMRVTQRVDRFSSDPEVGF